MSCVRNKRSALIVCCSIASLATLAAGDAVAQGVTPLRHAEQRGQTAIVEILRRAGATR